MLVFISDYLKPTLDITYKFYLNPVHVVQSKYLHVVKSKEKTRNISIQMFHYSIATLFIIYGTACVSVWDPKWQNDAQFFNFCILSWVILLAEIAHVQGNFNGIVKVLESTVILNQKLEREFT